MKLPARQRQIIELIADGKGDKEIASELCVSIHTVAIHIRRMLKRFSARNRAHAVAIWTRNNNEVISPAPRASAFRRGAGCS